MTLTSGIIKPTRGPMLLIRPQVITQGGSRRRLVMHADVEIASRGPMPHEPTCTTRPIMVSAIRRERPRLHQGRWMDDTAAEPLIGHARLGVSGMNTLASMVGTRRGGGEIICKPTRKPSAPLRHIITTICIKSLPMVQAST